MTVRRTWLPLTLVVLLTQAIAARSDDPPGFKDPAPREIGSAPFTDAEVNSLIATLDNLLAAAKDPQQWREEARDYLWTFVERLQAGQLSPNQEARVLARFDQLEQEHPGDTSLIERERHVLTNLTVGKTAPEILGKDMEGKELRLSDYRGNVVVLTFSGDWCGACRAEYPYQRLLLELYKDRPLTILGVSSDKDADLAMRAKLAKGLTYRSWWDGHAEKNTRGPIATAWGVIGWPTVYLLDDEGVIRFVNLRQEDLLKGVKQLMTELSAKPVNSTDPRK